MGADRQVHEEEGIMEDAVVRAELMEKDAETCTPQTFYLYVQSTKFAPAGKYTDARGSGGRTEKNCFF
jgi:hypothetical protein